jgi:hypothetical protein
VAGVTSFQNSVLAPVGSYILYAPAGIRAMTRELYIQFSNALFYQFSGKFRMFVRYVQTGGASGDFQMRYGFLNGTYIYGKTYTVPSSGAGTFLNPAYLDLGFIDIHSNELLPFYAAGSAQSISLGIACTSAAPGTLALLDLILLPVDELAVEISGNDAGLSTYAFTDSIIYPKTQLYAGTLLPSGNVDYMDDRYRYIGVVPMQLGANTQQRIWFLMGNGNLSAHTMLHATYMRKAERYLSMRGDQ